MGQTLSEPVTEKETTTVENDKYFVGSSSMQGWRHTMEDSHVHLLNVDEDADASYFAVFDGHGGSLISDYASQYLHKFIFKRPEFAEGNIEEALQNAIMELDAHMCEKEYLCSDHIGSTAIIVLIKGNRLYCANVGDSRAVACVNGRAEALSYDHKPNNGLERLRIENAGGSVEYARVNGVLALSRALGDSSFKKNDKIPAQEQIVTAYPDITIKELDDDWEFIVLACDGIWDVLSNEEVVDFVRSRLNENMKPDMICEELITRCLSPDTLLRGIGCDNMTVIIVCFLKFNAYKKLTGNISVKNGNGALVSEEASSASTASSNESSESEQRVVDEVVKEDGEQVANDNTALPKDHGEQKAKEQQSQISSEVEGETAVVVKSNGKNGSSAEATVAATNDSTTRTSI